MHPNRPLLNQFITLFSRPNCGLCENAKKVLQRTQEISPTRFNLTEVNIDETSNQKWHDLYAYDVPVIHIQPTETSSSYTKLMHRFKVDQIIQELEKLKDKT